MRPEHLTAAILATLATTMPTFAENELPDSLRTPRIQMTTPIDTADYVPTSTIQPSQPETIGNASYYRRATIDRQLPPVNPAAYTYRTYPYAPGIAPIYSWDTGSLYASGATTSLPGTMGIESGALNLRQNFGALSLHIHGDVSKYGGYFSGGGMPQPALAGYYDTPSIGAFLDYRFARKWGVRMGMRSERSMLSGQWETRPMLEPYFMLGGQSIGIDVGGILYELLRSKNNWGPRNPTIGPPVQKLSDTFH